MNKGYIRWYDNFKGEGIISDFDGNEYYFTSFSFPKTHYEATWRSKEDGGWADIPKGETISVCTRNFPGLTADRPTINDPICETLKSFMPVRFSCDPEISYPWAVIVELAPELENEVFEYRLVCLLDALLSCELGHERAPYIWQPHYEKRLERLLLEAA